MESIRLRQDFIDYFRKNKHRFMAPSKVYNDDPSLMFVNAGMNQLKSVILGQTEKNHSELTNYQICIRAGGKHNDLDDVGKDSYHLTSFEMLGNWSLNSYGKEQAIKLAFTFLTENMKLDKNRIYVTYYAGNNVIDADNETYDIWKTIVPENKIVKGSYKDNFWQMADDGPCGVSTEIHYDLIGNRDASGLVNKDDPNVIELWNLVFIQYNKIGNEYNNLGKLFIDTGMGLERLSMVLQTKTSLYQTDAFRYLISYAQILSGAQFFTDSYDIMNSNYNIDVAYRIFADHMRTVINALFDGVKFGANDREHVLKKIFRRALTFYYVHLNNKKTEPIMNKKIIRSLISDVLDYFLKKKHDVDDIQKQLIDEEQLYLGKVYNAKMKYYNLIKNKVEHNIIVEKLKSSFGIDQEIIKYIDDMEFHLVS